MTKAKKYVLPVAVLLSVGLIFLPWLHWIGDGYRPDPNMLDAVRRKIMANEWIVVTFGCLTVCLPIISSLEFIRYGKKSSLEQAFTSILILGISIASLWYVNIELFLNNGFSKIGYELSLGYALYFFVVTLAVIGTIWSLMNKKTTYNKV